MGYLPMSARVTTRAALAALLLSTLSAHAATTGKRNRQPAIQSAVYEYGPRGPNRSYQSGLHTRIYVSKRSWLDGGTEGGRHTLGLVCEHDRQHALRECAAHCSRGRHTPASL